VWGEGKREIHKWAFMISEMPTPSQVLPSTFSKKTSGYGGKMNNLNAEQSSVLEKLMRKSEDLLPKDLKQAEARNENFVKAVQLFFLTKYIRTFKAMLILIDQSFGEDAAILGRSLCEIWIKFLHSADFKEIDTWLYLRQKGIHRLKALGNWRRSAGGKLPNDYAYMKDEFTDEQRMMMVIEKIEELNKDLGQRCRDDFAENSWLRIVKNKNQFWPGKHLLDLLTDVKGNLEGVYGVGYVIPSDILHSNPGILEMYLGTENSNVVAKAKTDSDFAYDVFAGFAAGWLIDILYSLSESWSLGRQEEIKLLAGEWSRVFPDMSPGPTQAGE
jgi:hypothetical protein